MTLAPLLLPFGGVRPFFAEPAICGERTAILGRARVGRGVRIGADTVLRADGDDIIIGDGATLGAHNSFHIATGVHPCLIGRRVRIGDHCCIHACTVEDDCVIGDHVIVLDGSIVETGAVIESGSIVYPRSRLDAGFVYGGAPAQKLRPREGTPAIATAAEIPVEVYDVGPASSTGASVFVAATARLKGTIRAKENSSIWFSCVFDAGAHDISIGRNTNIQDNTFITCADGPFSIADNSAIGHNVRLASALIEENCLIGIGAVIAAGTRIENSVFVAAGTVTRPGQVLEASGFYAGNPARRISALDERKAEMIRNTVEGYRENAQAFKALQAAALAPLTSTARLR